jgi:hypothetical protein
MTAGAGTVSRPVPVRPGRWPAAGRLLRLELLNNAMLWLLPVAAALFWLTTYHKAMAMPPLWNMRARALQSGALLAFASPVAGAAAWMGSREGRRHTTDQVTVTARPRWVRQLATWAATTCWAMVGYLGCVAVLYGMTARQATWGGPLWWPAAVAAASLPALSALGFAAGAAVPSRFTAPLATIAAFFVLGLSTQLIQGSQSYWQVSPLVAAPWDIGPDAGVATFYHYLPDLPIAQIMFLAGLTVAVLGALALPGGPGGTWLRRPAAAITAAGLLAAGTAVALAGTGRLDAHGMIAIPALHDAASDRPVRYTPVCSHTRIPVCLNPAYAGYLAATVGALAPVLTEVAGLPGAPVRISQAAATYRQGPGNSVGVGLAGPSTTGRPPVFRLLLLDQLPGPAMTTSALAAALQASTGPAIVAGVTGDGRGASPAQQASRRRATGSGCPRLGRRPARRPMPRPAGSPRCRPPPGTPGWCGTWRRCGPAGSPWLSCHDRRRGARGGGSGNAGRRAAAGRATAGGTAPGAAARRQQAGPRGRDGHSFLRHRAEDRAGLELGHLRRAAAAAGVRGRLRGGHRDHHRQPAGGAGTRRGPAAAVPAAGHHAGADRRGHGHAGRRRDRGAPGRWRP